MDLGVAEDELARMDYAHLEALVSRKQANDTRERERLGLMLYMVASAGGLKKESGEPFMLEDFIASEEERKEVELERLRASFDIMAGTKKRKK